MGLTPSDPVLRRRADPYFALHVGRPERRERVGRAQVHVHGRVSGPLFHLDRFVRFEMITRRQALMSTLLGAGGIGLRALATGLPASRPAQPTPRAGQPAPSRMRRDPGAVHHPQYVGNGDPINASVPGTYNDPKIAHSLDPTMVPTPLTIQGQMYTAAAPWATLPQAVLDRTCFWHM
jgi:hypothetical protein